MYPLIWVWPFSNGMKNSKNPTVRRIPRGARRNLQQKSIFTLAEENMILMRLISKCFKTALALHAGIS